MTSSTHYSLTTEQTSDTKVLGIIRNSHTAIFNNQISGVTRRGGGGPPRATPSRGWHPSKFFCGFMGEFTKIVDKRGRRGKE